MRIKKNAPTSVKSKSSPLYIKEAQYFVKEIKSQDEKVKAHVLRHRVFAQELGWVSEQADLMESDHYDGKAVPLGVFGTNNELKGYLRIVLSTETYMLEQEFSHLVEQGHRIRKNKDTVEISRLCIEPEARNEKISGNFGVHSISLILYKGVYHWCLNNEVRYLYLVVEEKVCRMLCARGFPCKPVGEPVVMPDGIVAVAAILDWREFENSSRVKRPKMFEWFSQFRLTQPRAQLPQREIYSRHQAFS